MLQDLISNVEYDNDDKISKLEKNLLVKSDFHVVTLKNRNKNYSKNLRIEPREVNIYDFEVENHYTFSIKISNSAKDIQKLIIKPPKSSYLKVHDYCRKYFQGFELAPGLSIDIKIDLFVPFISKSSFSCESSCESIKDNSFNDSLFNDELIIILDYHYPLRIPIKAFPPDPELSFTEYIDFGKQMYVPINEKLEKNLSLSSNDFSTIKKDILLSNNDQLRLQSNYKLNELNKTPTDKSRLNSAPSSRISRTSHSIQFNSAKYSEEDWKWAIEKKFIIKNIGKIKTKFTITYDENLPIKVNPTFGVLDPIEEKEKSYYIIPSIRNENSIEITVKYLPCDVGTFNETLYINIEEDVKILKTTFNINRNTSNNNKTKTIMLHADVLKHSLSILDHNKEELNIQNITFRSIYYSQKHEIKGYIYNNDKKDIKYSIINSNALSPLLPPKKVFDFQNEIFNEKEEKTCISMTPYEGVIKPNQLFPVKFCFSPKLPPIIKGFKSIKPVYPSKKYETNLTLKIENQDNTKPEYYPINIQLNGEAHPVSLFVSNAFFNFTPTPLHFESVKKLKITNRSKLLPLSFYIKQIAHFKIKPNQGILQPEEVKEFDVIFKPNQFGVFNKKFEIYFFNKRVDKYIPPKLNDNEILEIVTLKVNGSSESINNENCRFPENMYHDKNINEINKTYIYEELRLSGPRKVENPERTAFVEHRKLYDMYIRSCYNNRELSKNLKFFNQNDFLDNCKNFGIHEDYSKIDIVNGLIPPEPSFSVDKNGNNYINNDKSKKEKKIKNPILKASTEFETLFYNNLFKYTELFKKLSEPNVIEPLIPCKLPVEQINNVELTTYDLIMIFSSSKAINFGEISCHSVNKIPFNILNGTMNKIPIHIKFEIENVENENISIYPNERSISPMDIGGFEIVFRSDEPGNYTINLKYNICNRYLYTIPITAIVLPAKIEVDKNMLNFSINFNEINYEKQENKDMFNRDELSTPQTDEEFINNHIDLPHVEDTLVLTNTGNFDVKYSWNLLLSESNNTLLIDKIPNISTLLNCNGIFYVEQKEGIIKKNSSISVVIKYFPSIKSKSEYTLVLNTIDYDTDTITNSNKIKCSAYIPGSKCYLVQTSNNPLFDFGILCKACPKKTFSFDCFNYNNHQYLFLNQNFKIIRIKNKGNNTSFYCVKPYSNSEIFIENPYGLIEPNSTLELKVWINPVKVRTKEDTLEVIIFGEGKNIKIPIKYECVAPKIDIEKSECQFKLKTIIGNSFSGDIRLYNPTRAPLTLLLDLRKYPEFEIKYSKSMKFLTPIEILNKIPNIKYHGIREIPQALDLANYFENIENFSYDTSVKTNLYLIDISPNERIDFQLIFKPEKISTYKFNIPIQVLDKNQNLNIPVFAESIISPLSLSKLKVYFENSIIRKMYDDIHITENIEEIEMTNQSDDTIKWKLEFPKESQNSNIFIFSQTSGTIPVNKSFKLLITFKPKTIGNFSDYINIYFGTNDYSNVICLSLNGNSVKPYILFDPPELYLPVVPYNEVSVVTFSIINYGCCRNELKTEIQNSVLEQVGHIDLYFPEGRLLKSSGEKLNVILQFVSSNKKNNPISFSSSIEFSEDYPNSKIYYLPIYGTSSNSCFTLYSYLWNLEFTKRQEEKNKNVFEIEKVVKEKLSPLEIISENKKKLRLVSVSSQFFTPNGIKLDENNFEEYNNHLNDLADVATRWLLNNTSYNIIEDPFPKCFVENNGAPLIEIINNLSGSNINKLRFSIPNKNLKKKEKIIFYYKEYLEIINNLKLWGALISNINPLYLLSKNNFIILQDEYIKEKYGKVLAALNNEPRIYYSKCREYFDILSKEVWVTILFQIINIFIFKNITLKQYLNFSNNINKKKSTLIEELQNHNNIYSIPEHILFSWIKSVLNKNAENEDNEFSYTCLINKNFQDFTILSDLLCAYVPSLRSYFSDINRKIQSQAYFERNSKIFMKVLNGLLCTNYPKISVGKVILGNIYEILLLLAFLYQLLPSISKIQTIEFTGKLKEPQTKTIEITNSNNQAMNYIAVQSGSLDFKINIPDDNKNKIYLKEKSSKTIEINFTGKFSKHISSFVRFIPKTLSFNHVSTINFKLVSNITEATLEDTIYIESPLYKNPPCSVNVEVKNPYEIEGIFKAILHEEVNENEYGNCTSFKISKKEIKLLPNKVTPFSVSFIPRKLATYKCILHFVNDQIGEFMYKIEGKTIYPLPTEVFQWSCRTLKTLYKTINIPFKNKNKEEILNLINNENVENNNNIKENNNDDDNKSKTKNNNNNDTVTTTLNNNDNNNNNTNNNDNEINRNVNEYIYKVEYSSDFFSGPKEFVFNSEISIKNLEKDGFDIPITFTPEFSGKYSCYIIIKRNDNDDYRVFLINCTSIPEGKKAKLEFNAPSRKEIVQNIPIINNTDNSWTIKPNLKGINFSTPIILNVKAHSTENFPVMFKSQIPCRIEGHLVLSNLQNNQKYEFDLVGISTEPLAEDNITISGKAREMISYSFPVHNYSNIDDHFTISTDLPIASSNTPLFVKAGEMQYCNVKLFPKSSGVYKNSITFTNQNMTNYIWFNVELNVDKPDPEGQIMLSSDVRKSVTLVLNISNKTDKTVQYKIIYKGECLSGKKSISILPQSVYEYELTYAPILSGKTTGCLMFHNDFIGDFWYILNCEAKDSPPLELPFMECPLGKNTTQSIILSNPTNQTVNIDIQSTNTKEFQVIDYDLIELKTRQNCLTSIILYPNEKKKVGLHFWPSSLNQKTSAKITFSSSLIGNIVYIVKGHGLKPELMDETLVTAILGDITTSLLSFNNPLLYSVNVNVELISETNTFQLLMKKNTFHVSANGNIEIPFTFIPKGVMKYSALLNITTETDLIFSYPLIGVVETSVKSPTLLIEGSTKQLIEKTLQIPLINYIYNKKKLRNKEKVFSINVENETNTFDQSLETLKLSLKEIIIEDDENINMLIKASFIPNQIMNKKFYLVVTDNASGGRWKYNLHIISHPPPIDDIITIEGSINKINYLSFNIKNNSNEVKKFRAFFDESSPPEFSIQPEYGQLVPEAQRGETDNQFVITYKPSYYGKILTGKLNIVCKDISWSYLVRGVPPKINLTKTRKSLYSNQIHNNTSSSVTKLKKVNYIKKNLKSFKK